MPSELPPDSIVGEYRIQSVLDHLPVEKMHRRARALGAPSGLVAGGSGPATLPATPPPRGLKEIEREAIVDALARCHGNQSRAAELLGMPRRTFCKRMKEFEIPRPRA